MEILILTVIPLILIGMIRYFAYANADSDEIKYLKVNSGRADKILVVDGIDYAHYKSQYDEFLKQFEIAKVEVQRDFDIAHYHVKVSSPWIEQLGGHTIHNVLPTNLRLMATAFDVIAVD